MFLLYSNIILHLFSNDFYLTGILSIVSATITILWLTLVAVLFWKFIFPINAMQYRKIEKWIHALAIVLGEHTHTVTWAQSILDILNLGGGRIIIVIIKSSLW